MLVFISIKTGHLKQFDEIWQLKTFGPTVSATFFVWPLSNEHEIFCVRPISAYAGF
jgi:hypothetical protein